MKFYSLKDQETGLLFELVETENSKSDARPRSSLRNIIWFVCQHVRALINVRNISQ